MDGLRSGAGSCPVDPGMQGLHLLQDELARRPQAVMSWAGMHHPVALGVTQPSGGVSGAAEEGLAGILQLRLGRNLLSTQFFKGVAQGQDTAHSVHETKRGRWRPKVAVGSEGGEVRGQRTGVGSRQVDLGPWQGLGQPWKPV